MPSNCCIEFDRRDGIYGSGEMLNGKIILRTDNSKTIRGVSITINGFASVRWSQRQSYIANGNTVTRQMEYTGHDQYLNSVVFVLGTSGTETFELQPGVHIHSFSCLLPSELPSSCDEKHGQISYEVIVTICREFMIDIEYKKIFTIVHPLNLNRHPLYRQPQKVTDESVSYWCCCCCCFGDNGAPVIAKMRIPHSGYAPGQQIPITLKIDNESNENIVGGKIKLTKRVIYESRTPCVKQLHDDSEICSEFFPLVRRLTKKEFKVFFNLPAIPASTPSDLSLSQCIRIEYMLSAHSYTASCRTNLTLSIPITIGTVPLRVSGTNLPNIISEQPTSTGMLDEIDDDETESEPANHLTIDPPSYEDAVMHYENANYKYMSNIPKYPMYHNYVNPPPASPPYTEEDLIYNGNAVQVRSTSYGWIM